MLIQQKAGSYIMNGSPVTSIYPWDGKTHIWLKDQWGALSASCQSKCWTFPIPLRPCCLSDHLAMRGLLRRKSLNNPERPTFSNNTIFNSNSNLAFFDISKSFHLVTPFKFHFWYCLTKDLIKFSVQIFSIYTSIQLVCSSHNRCLKDVPCVNPGPSHTIKHII